MSQPAPVLHKGIVKQVLSGDSIIIREQPRGGPPPEKNLGLSNVTAPKLCRRPTTAVAVESRDEPCAWESREFLRKQLIGKEVLYSVEYNAPGSQKHYGCVYLKNGDQLQNITEQSVMEGFLEVKRGGIKPSDDQSKLIDLEEAAKAAEKGKWAKDASEHVRNIHWSVENPKHFVDASQGKEFSAIIEHVRDGCTVRAFLLPDFYHVTVMMSGIKTPMFKRDGPTEIPEPFAEEAKFFTESRLLQKEVKIRLDGVSNANFLGTIIHPAGSISQLLLREGFARCVDWSMSVLPHGHDMYRSAERLAKQMKKRIWKDYEPSAPSVAIDKKEFTGKVTEVINADAIVVKTPDGSSKKLFLSSLRPPRLPTREDGSQEQQNTGSRRTRPLYDVPYMFEAREFLRKKLIGKKVNVAIDYIKPPSDGFPEKTCATVTIGTINVAEALISKGLATVVRHRQDDDQRSSHYDELLSAETRAAKNSKGLHSKKEAPTHRISEVSGDASKAKQFLPFLQRAGRISGIVEFVASGSRLRVYLPKETCLITLLLAGIECPRMQSTGNQGHVITGEPFGEDAYTFTRELCLQKDVEIEVSACDRAGNFIGWLFIDDVNLSLSLVKEGLSAVHFSAEKSPFYNQIVMAEENAKTSKLKIWSNFEEPKTVEIIDDTSERQCKYEKVVVTEVESPQCFWVQHADSASDIEQMMERLRSSLAANPPVPGSYTPRRGELCAALFSDNNWYRARVLKTAGPKEITVIYIDFGNIEVLPISKIRALPSEFTSMKPQAVEYNLALVREPNDEEMKYDLNAVFKNKILNNMFLLNKEYKVNNQEFVTLTHPDSKDDIGRSLIAEGLALVDKRNEKRFQKIIKDYFGAQESAKKNRLNMWRYGDITEDDAKEFGYPTK